MFCTKQQKAMELARCSKLTGDLCPRGLTLDIFQEHSSRSWEPAMERTSCAGFQQLSLPNSAKVVRAEQICLWKALLWFATSAGASKELFWAWLGDCLSIQPAHCCIACWTSPDLSLPEKQPMSFRKVYHLQLKNKLEKGGSFPTNSPSIFRISPPCAKMISHILVF